MSDLANETACPCATCRIQHTGSDTSPGEALVELRRRWANQAAQAFESARRSTSPATTQKAVRSQPRASQGQTGANDARVSRRHWRRWMRLPHLHHEEGR